MLLMLVAIMMPPLCILVFLLLSIRHLWKRMDSLPKVNGDTQAHTERIYRDFEFFVKVFMGLVAGFGYVKFKFGTAQPNLSHQAMIGIATIGMITMVFLVFFVAIHQGWKIRRWERVDWSIVWTWQEIYMMLCMYLFATALWIAGIVW